MRSSKNGDDYLYLHGIGQDFIKSPGRSTQMTRNSHPPAKGAASPTRTPGMVLVFKRASRNARSPGKLDTSRMAQSRLSSPRCDQLPSVAGVSVAGARTCKAASGLRRATEEVHGRRQRFRIRLADRTRYTVRRNAVYRVNPPPTSSPHLPPCAQNADDATAQPRARSSGHWVP